MLVLTLISRLLQFYLYKLRLDTLSDRGPEALEVDVNIGPVQVVALQVHLKVGWLRNFSIRNFMKFRDTKFREILRYEILGNFVCVTKFRQIFIKFRAIL
jgi:hypothetical protein